MSERFDYFEEDRTSYKKITHQKDTKFHALANFRVQKEDHTLGNLIRMRLLQDPRVLFAGYKLPHPLEQHIIIKVQTDDQCDPLTAFKTSVNDLQKEITYIEEQFRSQLKKHRSGSFY